MFPLNRSAKGIQEHELVEQARPFIRSLGDLLRGVLSEEETKLLPRGWNIIGNIIVLKIPSELEDKKSEIGRALLDLYPRCKSVYLDKGIQGELRAPSRELIASRGDNPSLTIHKENGCFFRLDVSRIMFSQGNLEERRRMSMLGNGEVVVDMFAGIGYFSIPMAVHSRPRKIIAIELNPLAFKYLKENIRLNHVDNVVHPVLGDCALLTPVGCADRVIMGYVLKTHHYLEQGIKALKKGGILHYHETTPEPLVYDRPIQRIREAALKLGRGVEVTEKRKIKKYSPGVWHIVIDAKAYFYFNAPRASPSEINSLNTLAAWL